MIRRKSRMPVSGRGTSVDGSIQGRSDSGDTKPGKAAVLPPWVDEALVRETQRVWGRYYPRGLTTDEAVEVIINVSQLLETVSQEDQR
jgi:hypothetical protein